MGTVRPASTESAKPRKRAPRKATPKPVVPGSPGVDPTPQPPTPVSPDGIAKLRQALADVGLNPDAFLENQPIPQPQPLPEPVVVDGTVVAVDPVYLREFEAIPGVDLDALRQVVLDARKNPVTAGTVIEGVRALIVDNGHDPDVVIAAALGTNTEPESESDAAARPDGLVNAFVDFHGRRIEVTAPEIEQVMVIRRMQSLFANAAKMERIDADEAIRLMDRALMAVCSVIVNTSDVEFLEDLLLAKKANITDTLPLLRESLKALERANADNGNRADRRQAAKSSGRTGRAALFTAGE